MTIKELYEEARQKGKEDYEIKVYDYFGDEYYPEDVNYYDNEKKVCFFR